MLNDPALSAKQARELSAFAGTMIPASAHYRVPGADDAQIVADILKTLAATATTSDVRSRGWLSWRAAPSQISRPSAASTSPTTFVPKAVRRWPQSREWSCSAIIATTA